MRILTKWKSVRLLYGLSCLFICEGLYAVTTPTWWETTGSEIFVSGFDIDDVNDPLRNDYAPINVGQLKNVATQAANYLDTALASVGGAGPDIDAITNFDQTGNYSPLAVGQMKNVTEKFYIRLFKIGHMSAVRTRLIDNGFPSAALPTTGQIYPWDTVSPAPQSENGAPVNVGQLLIAYSWDVSTLNLAMVDADADNLMDQWEVTHSLSPFDDGSSTNTNGPNGDRDGDGLTNLEEQANGSNPSEKDNPALSLTIFAPQN